MKSNDQQRRAELAKIHIGAKQVGLDPADPDPNSDYRAMLWANARVRSSSELDYAGRAKVLKHLTECGFKAKPGIKSKRMSAKLSDEPQHRMIRGLWLELHNAGVVIDPSETAILRFVKNQKRVERMEWLNQKQASDLIEALKEWRAREARKKAING